MNDGPRARFISFEGLEACGKTTQIGRLRARLEGLGHEVLLTREPGGTPLGEALRHLLKHAPEGKGISAEAELLLFSSSRAELVQRVIIPALDAGKWVLADRFIDSTTVYQGYARGIDLTEIEHIQRFAAGRNRPALTVVLQVTPEESRKRQLLRAGQSAGADHFDSLPDSFFAKVQSGYSAIALQEPQRVSVISGMGTADETEMLIWEGVKSAFSL